MFYIKSYLLLDLDLSLLCKYALIIIKNIRFYILLCGLVRKIISVHWLALIMKLVDIYLAAVSLFDSKTDDTI